MVLFSPCTRNAAVLLLFTLPLFTPISRVISGSNYFDDFDVTWGGDRGKILNNGELLTLSLDSFTGSGFQSRKEYLYGKIDMEMKLVPGNSAGTVTALYLSSGGGGGSDHDEIDFEFLGNVTGDPYTVHTNVYAQGKGEREQQFRLWFDPTKDFHTYSLVWNPRTIIFYVDRTPLREFKNLASKLVPFPLPRPMRLYSSLWNADDWATRGGLIKTDWSQAPFVASYRNFNVDACVVSNNGPATPNCSPWLSHTMDQVEEERLKWVHKNWMIYDYCTDKKRFPQGFPTECSDK